MRIHVRSANLPVGAGLGSSAAFSVALAAALLQLQLKLQLRQGGGRRGDQQPRGGQHSRGGQHPRGGGQPRGGQQPGGGQQPRGGQQEGGAAGGEIGRLLTVAPDEQCAGVAVARTLGRGSRPCDAARALINGWAHAAECVLHGTPSGLDNAVSCHGRAMRLGRSTPGAPLTFEPVEHFPPIRVLLTNTLVPRRTRQQVAKVRSLHETHPRITTSIFEAIASIADAFLDLVTERGGAAVGEDGVGEGGGGRASIARTTRRLGGSSS